MLEPYKIFDMFETNLMGVGVKNTFKDVYNKFMPTDTLAVMIHPCSPSLGVTGYYRRQSNSLQVVFNGSRRHEDTN